MIVKRKSIPQCFCYVVPAAACVMVLIAVMYALSAGARADNAAPSGGEWVQKGVVFVTAGHGDRFIILDETSHRPLKAFATDPQPYYFAVSPVTGVAAVYCAGSEAVDLINVTNDEWVGTINMKDVEKDVGKISSWGDATKMLFRSDGRFLYLLTDRRFIVLLYDAVDRRFNARQWFDAGSDTYDQTPYTEGIPNSVMADCPDGRSVWLLKKNFGVYALSLFDTKNSTMSEAVNIDGLEGAVIGSMKFVPDGSQAYVTMVSKDNIRLYAIDAASFNATRVADLGPAGDVYWDALKTDMAISGDGGRIYMQFGRHIVTYYAETRHRQDFSQFMIERFGTIALSHDDETLYASVMGRFWWYGTDYDRDIALLNRTKMDNPGSRPLDDCIGAGGGRGQLWQMTMVRTGTLRVWQ